MASQNDLDTFSVRIVSIDYYMSPPISDIDFCYSSFLGTKVQEVPVIRIYGPTPAGQKTCLHIHRALPYFYIPFPEELLQSLEEGKSFIHTLSSAIEKALKNKSVLVTKRQHVHGCSLVRAKKLYGYHPSEELFVKIFLYYPHDIARAASLLLDGSLLGKSFQPYESHIPYILQFMVDYNLYGMSYLHTSMVKFRSPLQYFHNTASLSNKSYAMQVTSSCNTSEKSENWLSIIVANAVVWPDSSDNTDNKCIHLTRRQSICQLEADTSAEDIINGKFKCYTSLSQIGFDVRMVQSLSPIWEEEYERSEIQERTEPVDHNRPHADTVLRSYMSELNYFMEKCSSLPLNKPAINRNENLVEYMKSFSDIFRKVEPLSDQSHIKSFDICLANGEEESKREDTSYSQSLSKKDLKNQDTEALGLLSWLASSQAEEEMDTGDELLHEAILSPSLPGKSFSMALEIAKRDYEHASQQECLDILDSVEGIIKSERSHGNASFSLEEKLDVSIEPALSFSLDFLDNVSSSSVIPQVDGSFDDSWKNPKEDFTSETNAPYRGKVNGNPGVTGLKVGSKPKERKLWGNLPISSTKSDQDASDSTFSSCDEMKDDDSCNVFHNKEGNHCDILKSKKDAENTREKSGNILGLCSVRDLMRKKRYLRIEQTDAGAQGNEDTEIGQNDESTLVMDGFYLPVEKHSLEPSITQDLHETIASSIDDLVFQGTECFENQSSVCQTVTGQKRLSSCSGKGQLCADSSEIIGVNQGSIFREQNIVSNRSVNFAMRNASMKFLETSNAKFMGSASHAIFPGLCRDERPSNPRNMNKCQSNHNEEYFGNDDLQSDGNKVRITEMDNKSYQQPSCLLDNSNGDFCKNGASQKFIEMTYINKPPSNDFLLDLLESLPKGHAHVKKDKRQGAENIMPFFPRISLDAHLNDENNNFNRDSALGIPTHFKNDGSLLYLLSHALSPPTLNSVYNWLSGQKQQCLLESAGACQTTSSQAGVGGSQYDSSQPSDEICSPKAGSFNQNTGHISIEPKLDNISAGINEDLHDFSQISGPEKYENSNPTPLSQIGFRDPASICGGQHLTLMSIELQAESRGTLSPDPKFDAINFVSLVIQEDSSKVRQIDILLRIFEDKPGEKDTPCFSNCNLFHFIDEKLLLEHFVEIIFSVDPDILMGWEVQNGSLGYLAERALHLGMNLLERLSRTPFQDQGYKKDLRHSNLSDSLPDVTMGESVVEPSLNGDEWGHTHASGLHVGGRIVLNIWRLMRAELKLSMYTAEAVAEAVLRQKIPLFSGRILNKWYSSGVGRARDKCIRYVVQRAILNVQIMDQLDMINRTSELARIFGIDFFSVISRGSQFRVESMLLRLAHTQNYLAISPGYQQVAAQPAMECLPLVMEPESGFYADPVVVLDFQSLYPSMIIAYNLCFCTCLGNAISARENVLGVSSYSPDAKILKDLGEKLLITPNGVMYVPSEARKGVLPRLLEEILSTRIMVKQAMKKLKSSQLVLHRILNARQLALKLIANVTYGYTAAGFSGRMPCAEIADSIVQCGRKTLETAISYVNQHESWKAKVIYGDTDSMFVLLSGRSKEDAFIIGNEIASAITSMNPEPVALKMEKIYHPCFLLTKKRYVGYSFERPDQKKPTFDAKGIETVRRDTCAAVAKTLERSIRLIFESKDLSEVKSYLKRQWTRILSGKIALKDFIFAKEVRLGTYRASSLPPAAIVAKKAMEMDPRAEPRFGERVPYIVVHGEPGSRLMDMVVNPFALLDLDSAYRLNDMYYINKQIIPALQRVFGLIGADVHQWFSTVPRPARPMLSKEHALEDDNDSCTTSRKPQAKRIRIDTFYSSKHCFVCGDLIQSLDHFCLKCLKKESLITAAVVGKTSKKEREMHHLAEICRHCGGGDWIVESGVKCISLACSLFYERRKVQKELQTLSSFAAAAGFYPPCNAELF